MNIQSPQPSVDDKTTLTIIDVDIHPKTSAGDLRALSEPALVGLPQDIWHAATAGVPTDSLIQKPAECGAPRFLAARRRIARQRSRFHEEAIS